MTHAQLNATGRRRDCAASWRVGKLFDAPLFAVSRKDLLKASRDAVRALALDRSERQLIECLAVCFGEQQLAHGLLCWPSNAQIEKKTGMSERTIRRTIVKKRSMSGTMSWDFTASDGSTAIICFTDCRCMTVFILCVKGSRRYRSGSNLSRSFAIRSCSSVH